MNKVVLSFGNNFQFLVTLHDALLEQYNVSKTAAVISLQQLASKITQNLAMILIDFYLASSKVTYIDE